MKDTFLLNNNIELTCLFNHFYGLRFMLIHGTIIVGLKLKRTKSATFPAWGILRYGVDSCNLKCSCNSVILMKCSDYHNERESHFLAIVNKPCALISYL